MSETALIDAGPLIAFYNNRDRWHQKVYRFLEEFKGQLISTIPVVTEVLHLLSVNAIFQNEFLSDLANEHIVIENLTPLDFKKLKELNLKYADIHPDFADLSLIVVSERLAIENIVSLDRDFDIYRRYRNRKFNQLLPREKA